MWLNKIHQNSPKYLKGKSNLLVWRGFALFKTSPTFFTLGQMSDSVRATHPTILCLPTPPRACHSLLYMISKFLRQPCPQFLTFFPLVSTRTAMEFSCINLFLCLSLPLKVKLSEGTYQCTYFEKGGNGRRAKNKFKRTQEYTCSLMKMSGSTF